jgi:predicted transcriptional regulator
MSENKDFEKLVIHISRERAEKLDSIADQLKLSRGSIIRQALDDFFESKATDKKTKK